jgi:hypothetical protein
VVPDRVLPFGELGRVRKFLEEQEI